MVGSAFAVFRLITSSNLVGNGDGSGCRLVLKADYWFRRRLRLHGLRRNKQAESENDREPDQPHGHLDMGGWRESMTRELNVRAVASVTA